MNAKPLISLVVPVYNEEDNIALFYAAVSTVIDAMPEYDFEFVFTDNHSQDRTPELLHELALKDKRVRAYRFSRNFGYQRSVLTAYLLSSAKAITESPSGVPRPPWPPASTTTYWRPCRI